MKERPISFKPHEARYTLDGRQTQFRRIMSNQPAGQSIGPVYVRQVGDGFQWYGEAGESSVFPCPYGKPGDRLWVRETVSRFAMGRVVAYKADNDNDGPMKWRPSIHMPRWASRITLEVESVRVERLQGIDGEDAEAEGIERCNNPDHGFIGAVGGELGRLGCPGCSGDPDRDAIEDYRTLWESINGPGSWDANPWVWVVAFKQVTPTTP